MAIKIKFIKDYPAGQHKAGDVIDASFASARNIIKGGYAVRINQRQTKALKEKRNK